MTSSPSSTRPRGAAPPSVVSVRAMRRVETRLPTRPGSTPGPATMSGTRSSGHSSWPWARFWCSRSSSPWSAVNTITVSSSRPQALSWSRNTPSQWSPVCTQASYASENQRAIGWGRAWSGPAGHPRPPHCAVAARRRAPASPWAGTRAWRPGKLPQVLGPRVVGEVRVLQVQVEEEPVLAVRVSQASVRDHAVALDRLTRRLEVLEALLEVVVLGDEGVAGEAARGQSRVLQRLGHGDEVVGEEAGALVHDPVLTRLEPGEQAGRRGPGPAGGGPGLLVDEAAIGEAREVRGRGPVVAVGRRAVGALGVHHHQHEVGAVRGRGGARDLARLDPQLAEPMRRFSRAGLVASVARSAGSACPGRLGAPPRSGPPTRSWGCRAVHLAAAPRVHAVLPVRPRPLPRQGRSPRRSR